MRSQILSVGLNSIRVFVAESWLQRLVGLIGRRTLGQDDALLLAPCGSIHTMWMRFSIDVVFLDQGLNVLKTRENVKPFRFCVAPKGTHMVLELAAGNVKRTGIHLEQTLKFD